MGTTAQKLEYLGTTKSQLKDMINYGLDDNNKITSSTTFRNYVSSIFNAFLEALRTPDTLFTNLPKKSGTGANISLTGVANAPMRITLSPSELTQSGTPTPSSPQEVHTISGDNKVYVGLPKEYTQVDYIESTGTQYIATNIANTGYTSESEVCWTTLTSRQIMGASGVGFWGINDGKYEIYQVSDYSAEVGRWDKVVFQTKNISSGSLRYLTVNDNVLFNGQTSASGLSGYIYLFIIGTNPDFLSLSCKCKLKYQKIWDKDGKLIRHFIPCFRNSDNVVGMYDIIGNQFYTNAGTGTFSYGSVLNVSQEAEIDLGVENELKINSTLITNRNATGLTSVLNYDSSISFAGTSSGTTRWFTSNDDNKQLFKSGTYTFFIQCNDSSIECGLSLKGASTSTTSTKTTSNHVITFTMSEDFYVYNGKVNLTNNTAYNFIMKIYLIKGSEVQTMLDTPINYCKISTYEDKFIRTSGKNLLDTQYFQQGSIDSSTGQDASNSYNARGSNYIEVLPNTTYTISTNVNVNDLRLSEYNSSKGHIQRDSTSNSKSLTITTTANTYYVRWSLNYNNSTQTTQTLIDGLELMLNEGGTALDYEPYGNGTWYIKKNIGKYTFTGSESWEDRPNFTESDRFVWNAPSSTFTNNLLMCSHLQVVSSGGTPETIRSNNNQIVVNFSTYGTTTLADFKTWLSTNNMYVEYFLLNPTYTQITGTLETQLENVYQKLLSYTGQTNISQINNDLPFIMNVSAIEN